VDKVFNTFAKLASSSVFSLAKVRKQLAKNIERVNERVKKKLARLARLWVCIFFSRQS
jgi:IS1 family transposase